jgi:hypothetical protein
LRCFRHRAILIGKGCLIWDWAKPALLSLDDGHNAVQVIFGDFLTAFFQHGNVLLNCFLDVFERRLNAVALRDAARQRGHNDRVTALVLWN